MQRAANCCCNRWRRGRDLSAVVAAAELLWFSSCISRHLIIFTAVVFLQFTCQFSVSHCTNSYYWPTLFFAWYCVALPHHRGSASIRLSHLHWLLVRRRIQYKISILTYKSYQPTSHHTSEIFFTCTNYHVVSTQPVKISSISFCTSNFSTHSDTDIQHLWRQSFRSCRPRTMEQSSVAPERRWHIVQWIPPVAKDILVWTVGPRRSVNCINGAD